MVSYKEAVLGLVIVVMVFYFLTSMASIDSVSATDASAELNATLAYTPVHTPVNYFSSVANASLTCTASNYTISGNTIIMNAGSVCAEKHTYNIGYYYSAPKEIMGVDFGFVVIIAVIIIGAYAFLSYWSTKK